MAITFTTPVGRIVQGEPSKLQKVLDSAGNPKTGTDGQPETQVFFAIAIPKQPGHTHWNQTDWGKQVWDEGNRAHPNFAPHSTFAWKVEDGDSQLPNKKGKKNADRPGFPGHWILKFRNGFVPATYNRDGSANIPADAIKCGYYVQVRCTVKGNTGPTPGIYLNPDKVALSGYGEELATGEDVAEAGFGAAPLPVGASATPMAAQGFESAPSTATAAPAPAAVPNPAVLQVPTPAAPPVPSAPPAHKLTDKAGGATYEQLIAAGWNDQLLVQHGLMLP